MGTRTIVPDWLARAAEILNQELVTSDDFAALLHVSKRTLFRLRAKGAIPEPVEVSTNIVRWRTGDVRAYLDSLTTRKPRRSR